MRDRIAFTAIVCQFAFIATGCARLPEPSFTFSTQVQKLKPEFQDQIRKLLRDQTGTPLKPKLLGSPEKDVIHMARGAEVYTRYCVQCHGVNGDGNGVAAQYLIPKPRNYQLGIFKFTSTVYGAKPLREDLLRTIKRGIRGTSMPAFPLLPPKDIEAVVDYVLALTHRGEFEAKLAEEAEFNEQIDEKRLPEFVTEILSRWRSARSQVVYPTLPMPDFKKENVEAGKQAFLTKGCAKCHGDDGRGMLATNVGVDSWGNPTKAADLTSGMLRGGTEPLDIYRHVFAGINGTPMPAFKDALAAEPQTFWNLVSYVLHVADIRREGYVPDSGYLEDGLLKPLPGITLPGGSNAPVSGEAAKTAATGQVAIR